MPTRTDPRIRGNSRYFLHFAGTATLLVAGTLVLVLYVLPQRYVLSSGFREGGLNLPTPSIPFEPTEPLRVAAVALPSPPGEVPRGPAELFWERVLPLLRGGRYEEAIPLFATYLGSYPGDLGVRKEYAITLTRAGYGSRAIPLLEGLLEYDDDPALHLLLARTLRDEGRVAEASEHYEHVLMRDPDDEAVRLELAAARAWIEDYAGAERVLLAGLDRRPESPRLRVELARIYYFTDRLEEAAGLLAALSETELAALDAIELRDGVIAALTPPLEPEVEPPPPPTLLEQAVAAREEGDFARASELFEAALAASPDDADSWQAYADFLQYAMEDFDGALSALGEVERIRGGDDAALQYRMAQLEVWTGRTDQARARLEALLVLLGAEAPEAGRPDEPAVAGPAAEQEGTPAPSVADVQALLGDLDRWEGRRLSAARHYRAALADDPSHEGASEGMRILETEVDRMMVDLEEPGMGALASALADTEDFLRLDLGGAWTAIVEDWVWSTRAGSRWLEGVDLTGSPGSRQGIFADLEGARWWRLGTVRTAARVGLYDVRGSVDLSVGASVRVTAEGGGITELDVEHAPAYASTNTLQSALGDLRQDRVVVEHARSLGERWSLAGLVDVASLDAASFSSAARNLRLSGGASLGRVLSRELTLGVALRALRYRDAAPDAAGFPLYWDPEASLSVGPYVQWARAIGTWWEMTGRLNPGIAWIDERTVVGFEAVPDLSARLELAREGARYRTGIALTYGQGRFSGYRSFGLDLSFSARGWLGRAARAGGAATGGETGPGGAP